MHPGQRKSFPEGSQVIRQAGAASHVEESHHGLWLMIKAGMWQAGARLDLSAELLEKYHMAFGCNHHLEPGLPLDSWECLLPICCCLGALIHLGEKFQSLHRPSTKSMSERRTLYCSGVCAESLHKECGSSREKATNSAWECQE